MSPDLGRDLLLALAELLHVLGHDGLGAFGSHGVSVICARLWSLVLAGGGEMGYGRVVQTC